MMRVAVIGNSGGGKSVLARRLAADIGLPYIEVDAILWLPGWRLVPAETYQDKHARIVAQDRWVMDGLGSRESIPPRLARATDIVLVDMPLWVHFSLAAERQMRWAAGHMEHPPAGIGEAPPLRGLFKTIWEVDQVWMPEMRELVGGEERRGKRVFRLTTLEELSDFGPSRLGTAGKPKANPPPNDKGDP